MPRKVTIELTKAQAYDVATCLEHAADQGLGLGWHSLTNQLGPMLHEAAYRRRYALSARLIAAFAPPEPKDSTP